MMDLDFSVVPPYAGLLAQGLGWTLLLTAAAAILSLLLGMLFALVILYAPRWISFPTRAFMWLFMGTPLLIQLFLIYYGLGQLGIKIPVLLAGIIGLGLHFAVYNADIFRVGICSVDSGQAEAARSIGFSHVQALLYVVVPQAVRNTVPPVGSNMIALLKDSSMVSVIGISELVLSARSAISETYMAFEFYLTIAAIYYIINLVMEAVLRRCERQVELSR